MNRLVEFINLPFLDTNDLKRNLRSFLVISLFVTCFLWFFRPFGLQEYSGNTLLLSLEFGLITFVVCFLVELAEVYLFRIDKEHPSWTFGRWLLSSIVLLLCIALGNFLFINFLSGWQEMAFHVYLTFIINTVAIGIFPLFFAGLVSLSRHKRHFDQLARTLPPPVHNSPDLLPLTLPSRSGEDLCVPAADVLFLEATQNYVTVYYRKNGQVARYLIRNTLKEVQQQLAGHPGFLQCHRSYIVNCDHVDRITGNSQGLLLHLDEEVPGVPVSRTFIPAFRQL